MNGNMALLSQQEIDTLIEFITKNRDEVDNNVLDQESIDKLMTIIRANRDFKISFHTALPTLRGSKTVPYLILDKSMGATEQTEKCKLIYGHEETNNFVRLSCVNNETGDEYRLTPNCIARLAYSANDDSQWGEVIPPSTFDMVADLLQVTYTKDTFTKVCEEFAQLMYHDKNTAVPEFYMPAAASLIQHLV